MAVKDKLMKVKDKFKELLIDIQVFLASVMLAIYYTGKDCLNFLKKFIKEKISKLVKAVKYCVYQLFNFALRTIGVILKLPTYLLNKMAISGNILQMTANHYKAKAQLLKDDSE